MKLSGLFAPLFEPSRVRMGLLLLSAAMPLMAWSSPAVQDIRISSQADSTRVVLELNEPAKQKIFTLNDPTRVVIDLSGTSLNTTLPDGSGLVKSIRSATHDGALRVVLDINGNADLQSSVLDASSDYGPRLVLDLQRPGAAHDASASSSTSAVPVLASSSSSTSSAEPQPVKTLPALVNSPRDLIIAVDPGHGGVDPGATGLHGLHEKDVTLAIARLLKERIDAEPGMQAKLTRDGDYFVPLRERIEKARQFKADMFISIHADSVRDHSVTGSSVYTLSSKGATNEAARWLADRENAADLVGGVSLDDKNNLLASVLLDLTQGASMSASMDAASRVLEQLDRVGNIHHSVVQQAGFVVLKSPDIPSMLVETAFISNPREEARLSSPQHQAKLADAILAGVREYFYVNTPPGTRLAQIKATRQARNN
ncbi:MAG: N-acetylmuramoyl-L-alanine amidase [Solimonas sp.]